MANTRALLFLVCALAPPAAHAQFVEPDVRVIHALAGETAGESFGWAVAELADIDEDGVGELIVAAPTAGDEAPGAGRVYVYSGQTGALLHRFSGAAGDSLGWSIGDAGDLDGDGVHDIAAGATARDAGRVYLYSGRTGTTIDELPGELPGDFFGFAVSSVGDLDGDRVPELLVSAARASSVAFRAGRAYLYSGRTRTLLQHFDGESAGDLFGTGAAGTGDLDGDGRGDFIVGARNAGPGPVRPGRAYVYSGRTRLPLFPPLEPAPTGVDFGFFFVATPGDVDGDSRPDLFVGDPSEGRAYVFGGRDARALYEFPGVAGDGTGCGRGARDVDGDRRADLIVGAYLSSEGAPFAGKVTVFSGCDGSALRTFTSTTAGETVGFDSLGVGDLDGDGEADFALAAATGDRVYLVAGARTCVADFDRDGRVDGRDTAAFVRALLRRDPRADTNCDARIDLADHLNFLRAMLRGCG
jgi:hypothetical protein